MIILAALIYKYVMDDDDFLEQACGGRGKKNRKKLRYGGSSGNVYDSPKKKNQNPWRGSKGGNDPPLSRKNSATRDMNGNIRHKPRGVVKGRRNSSNRPGKRNSRRDSNRRNSNRNSRRTSRAESMRASRSKMSMRASSMRQSTNRSS